jgi:hypothetical protein
LEIGWAVWIDFTVGYPLAY